MGGERKIVGREMKGGKEKEKEYGDREDDSDLVTVRSRLGL